MAKQTMPPRSKGKESAEIEHVMGHKKRRRGRRSRDLMMSVRGRRAMSVLLGCTTSLIIYKSLPLFTESTQRVQSPQTFIGPCAINLYGLPRKFKDLVLPGLVENVIKPNARYECDYFVHYYDRREESDYRGADIGRAGTIDPEEIKLLTAAVEQEHASFQRRRIPKVEFRKDSEESFFHRYNPLLTKIYNDRGGPDNNLLYIPLSEAEPFPNATIVNIIKMWHSQESVWNLMEPPSSGQHNEHYSRVAMLRSDVLYVTPIDIYKLPDGSMDYENQYAVVPNFANFPVNDRMIYGPADGVKIWAAGRFKRLQRHVERVLETGDGIHPERYLYHTIFPAIRDAGVQILPGNKELCFLRVRSDLSLRAGDCGRGCVTDQNKRAVEYLLQRPCLLNRNNPDVSYYECNDNVRKQSLRTTFIRATYKGCPWKV